ncbi:MAG: hypothetical protein RSE00_00515, partial [Clostridia bacterium]
MNKRLYIYINKKKRRVRKYTKRYFLAKKKMRDLLNLTAFERLEKSVSAGLSALISALRRHKKGVQITSTALIICIAAISGYGLGTYNAQAVVAAQPQQQVVVAVDDESRQFSESLKTSYAEKQKMLEVIQTQLVGLEASGSVELDVNKLINKGELKTVEATDLLKSVDYFNSYRYTLEEGLKKVNSRVALEEARRGLPKVEFEINSFKVDKVESLKELTSKKELFDKYFIEQLQQLKQRVAVLEALQQESASNGGCKSTTITEGTLSDSRVGVGLGSGSESGIIPGSGYSSESGYIPGSGAGTPTGSGIAPDQVDPETGLPVPEGYRETIEIKSDPVQLVPDQTVIPAEKLPETDAPVVAIQRETEIVLYRAEEWFGIKVWVAIDETTQIDSVDLTKVEVLSDDGNVIESKIEFNEDTGEYTLYLRSDSICTGEVQIEAGFIKDATGQTSEASNTVKIQVIENPESKPEP